MQGFRVEMDKKPIIPSMPISKHAKQRLGLPATRYDSLGYLRIESRRQARELAALYANIVPGSVAAASDLFGAAYILSAWRLLLEYYAKGPMPYERAALAAAAVKIPPAECDKAFRRIALGFLSTQSDGSVIPSPYTLGPDNLSERDVLLRCWTLISMSAHNPAFVPFGSFFEAPESNGDAALATLWNVLEEIDAEALPQEPESLPPLATLKRPVQLAPFSVKDQLNYILLNWGSLLESLWPGWMAALIGALDMIEEEKRPRFGGSAPNEGPAYSELDGVARFSDDDDWMPHVVLLAKNILVWLNQLSRKYARPIQTLSEIPDEELDILASRNFNALWLIGLWQRSKASREIKKRMGNPEAAASAYSLNGYDIAEELGGWPALENLKHRARLRGIRLSSDMVPNHVGINSAWVKENPDRLMSVNECPFPAYSFNSDNLSDDPEIDIRLEDHYWNRSDAAVVFKRTENNNGQVSYIYHGNDGTTMPWNDTAQIDFLNPEAREAVAQDILHVARNFPIIRFDAAMVLARKHIRRLWYPAPGSGGAIPSRSEHALSDHDFIAAMPNEFWREVVDRIAIEAPGTLLLAEAFWMMEGYFVRALGMHRVYNSAFMNMLRDQKNKEYRGIIKETLIFDPRILQRFVNFMNNPDEETAIEQFGGDDRYFAVCTLLATLPGLPMFGHGQIEGLSEKYGMEYVRAYNEETPNTHLIHRHEREIFPLLARRSLFSGASSFRLYNLNNDGKDNENLFAFTNSDGRQRTLVLVNNSYPRASGQINYSVQTNLENKLQSFQLAQALGVNKFSDDYWLLMHEHLSNLWYLRSVKSMKSEGLHIMLDGFGRQVFMNFRVEQESHDKPWNKLAAKLEGWGVINPDAALEEIRLQPIHDILQEFLSQDRITILAGAIRRAKTPSLGDNAEKLLVKLAGIHMRQQGAAPRELRNKAGNCFMLMNKRLKRSAKILRPFYRRKFRRLTPIFYDEAIYLSLWSLLASLQNLARSISETKQEIWQEWGLEGLLNQLRFAQESPSLMQALRTTLAFGSFKNTHPLAALSELVSNPVVRESCGINFWNDTLWYNKEGWELCVRSVLLSAEADETMDSRPLRRLLRKWHRAHRRSGYRVASLLEACR